MGLTVTAAQRDALYDQILDRLSGIGDIAVAIQAENYGDAERIGREYSDDLRLLLDDLGIGERAGRSVELSTPPEVLRRVLPRLRDSALESHGRSRAGVDRSPGPERAKPPGLRGLRDGAGRTRRFRQRRPVTPARSTQ